MSDICEEFFYRVKKDDTLLSVSVKLKVPFTVIIADNNLFREIEEGDLLYIKREGVFYTAQLGDTFESIASRFYTTVDEIKRKNRIEYLFYGLTLSV